jgi:ribonuclease HI
MFNMKKEIKVYTDAASRSNPGKAACAFIFVQKESIFFSFSKYLGKKTNNEAEYEAVILALREAANQKFKKINIYSDSELAIKQIKGEYKIKKEHLKKKIEEVKILLGYFDKVSFFNVSRENEFIQICDKMCNAVLDKK